MSSSTPEGAGPPDQGETPAAGQDPGSANRAAIRTSLAERFAAAKGEPAVAGPTSPVDQTATTAAVPEAADAGGGQPGTEQARSSSAPSAPSPAAPAQPTHPVAQPGEQPTTRFGATATSTSEPRPAAGATRLGTPPEAAAQAQAQLPPQGQAAARPAGSARTVSARKVRLSVARVDPWSVMKLAFLMSIAIGIGIVVAAAAMWFLLDSMHVFADLGDLLTTLGSADLLQLMEYAEFDRVMSMAAIVAVVDIFLLTALSTLAAFLYNIVAALVGGVHLTLTDD